MAALSQKSGTLRPRRKFRALPGFNRGGRRLQPSACARFPADVGDFTTSRRCPTVVDHSPTRPDAGPRVLIYRCRSPVKWNSAGRRIADARNGREGSGFPHQPAASCCPMRVVRRRHLTNRVYHQSTDQPHCEVRAAMALVPDRPATSCSRKWSGGTDPARPPSAPACRPRTLKRRRAAAGRRRGKPSAAALPSGERLADAWLRGVTGYRAGSVHSCPAFGLWWRARPAAGGDSCCG